MQITEEMAERMTPEKLLGEGFGFGGGVEGLGVVNGFYGLFFLFFGF